MLQVYLLAIARRGSDGLSFTGCVGQVLIRNCTEEHVLASEYKGSITFEQSRRDVRCSAIARRINGSCHYLTVDAFR